MLLVNPTITKKYEGGYEKVKEKRIYAIFIFIAILIAIVSYIGIGYMKNKDNEMSSIGEEYTPQEEISEAQMRETVVTLYFVNSETNELMPEARRIDAKELLNEPYEYIINLLIEGPKSEKLSRLIPESTFLNDASLQGNCVCVDFSVQFIENFSGDDKTAQNIIYSIVNSLTELNEVNSVKFTINGESKKLMNMNLNEEYVRI